MITKQKRPSITDRIFRLALGIVPALAIYGMVSAAPAGRPPAADMAYGYDGGAVSTPIAIPDGAVGAPSLAFSSAPTTGMWYTGGQIHFSTAGADRGYFSSVGVTTTNAFSLNALSYITSPSSGVIKLTDTNDNSFARLQLGGTTSSFPALRRVNTVLEARLADDSADTVFTAGSTSINSTGQYLFSSTSSADGSADTGLTRSSAGLVKVTDGSSGTGSVTINNATLAGTLTSARTTDFGWTVQSGANVACNTTCTSACIVGFDAGTSNTPVACTDATADKCLCAGAS